MRKIVAGLSMSLDGVVESPEQLRLYARERLAEEGTPVMRRAALERTLQACLTTAQEPLRRLRLRPPELPEQATPTVPR